MLLAWNGCAWIMDYEFRRAEDLVRGYRGVRAQSGFQIVHLTVCVMLKDVD